VKWKRRLAQTPPVPEAGVPTVPPQSPFLHPNDAIIDLPETFLVESDETAARELRDCGKREGFVMTKADSEEWL